MGKRRGDVRNDFNFLSVDASSHFSTGVTAYLLPPRPKDLYINRNARLVCVVVNLQQEEGLKISWSREKKVAMHPELVAVTEENNGTFTAVGHLPVSALDWESGETFTCSVEYPGLPGPIVNTISRSPGKEEAEWLSKHKCEHLQYTIEVQFSSLIASHGSFFCYLP